MTVVPSKNARYAVRTLNCLDAVHFHSNQSWSPPRGTAWTVLHSHKYYNTASTESSPSMSWVQALSSRPSSTTRRRLNLGLTIASTADAIESAIWPLIHGSCQSETVDPSAIEIRTDALNKAIALGRTLNCMPAHDLSASVF